MVTETEKEVLVDLQESGDNIPANIAENIERHPKHVIRVMREMQEKGLLRNKGRGVYTLSPDGRELVRSERSTWD